MKQAYAGYAAGACTSLAVWNSAGTRGIGIAEPTLRTLVVMPCFGSNPRTIATFVVGILIALTTLLIVPSRAWSFGEPYKTPHFNHPPPFQEHGPESPSQSLKPSSTDHGPEFPGNEYNPASPRRHHDGEGNTYDHEDTVPEPGSFGNGPDTLGPGPDEFLRPHFEHTPSQGRSYVGQSQRGRYDSVDVWRGDTVIPDSEIPDVKRSSFRPFQPAVSSYLNTGEYLKQTLVADYAGPLTEKVFFMLKTGATVMWERMPMHMATTLTRVKNFAIYSDMASSVAGYEVIDILKDMPQRVIDHDQLEMYRILRNFHEQGLGGEVRDLKLDNKGWNLDKFKNIPMMAHAYETSPESEWFVFMDDDSYMFWGNIEIALSKLDYREPYYLGNAATFGFTLHGEKVPYFAHGGSGVIISKGAMDLVFGPSAKHTHQEIIDIYSDMALKHCCGDMMVAYMLFEEAMVAMNTTVPEWPWMRRLQGEPAFSVRWREDMWCEPLMSFHHLSPHELEYLWEYERLKQKGSYILHADLYHDWLQPYIVEEKANWLLWEVDDDNQNDNQTIFRQEDVYEHGTETYIPTESASNCKKACLHHDNCMAWHHRTDICIVQNGLFRRGLGTSPLHKNWPGSVPTSGWMIDRIRRWRGGATCDALTDDNEFPEGWFIRAKELEKQAQPRN